MSALARKLALLRGESGAATGAPTSCTSLLSPMASRADASETRSILRQALRRRDHPGAVLAAVGTASRCASRQPPGSEISAGLHLEEIETAWPMAGEWVDASFAGLGPIARGRLLLFDTETTGLAGGTGTRAFQIGAAQWRAGRFRIRQLTLTALGGETEMLRRFAAWLDPDTVLVSYNGRSYDAPLLATRFRLNRLPDPFCARPHLDLLHPTRRRYRGRWENCRLSTIERRALNIVREDDLPGSEAPRAWLSFLRGGSAVDLHRVSEHNRQDLRSLAALLLHLGEAPA